MIDDVTRMFNAVNLYFRVGTAFEKCIKLKNHRDKSFIDTIVFISLVLLEVFEGWYVKKCLLRLLPFNILLIFYANTIKNT